MMSLEDRFWAKVVMVPLYECWVWIGATNGRGYGQFGRGGRSRRTPSLYAHRFAWELENGPIPDGLQILHICDNPGCVRPSHMRLGTHADNMADAAQKGRMSRVPRVRGEEVNTAKLTASDVVEIRTARARGESARSLATRFGLTYPYVFRILSRDTWKHVP